MDQHAVNPDIAAAIVAVMAEVPKLNKDERNQHGNYSFASVDGFLSAIRPICAKHGLCVLTDELDTEVAGGNLSVKFGFTLIHKSGASLGPLARTVQVNAKMGAQAYGAAQSYALKQFLRATFQVATGDGEDADATAHNNLTDTRPRTQAKRKPQTDVCAELRREVLNAAKASIGSDEDDEAREFIQRAKARVSLDGVESRDMDATQLQILLDAIMDGTEVAA